MNKPSLVMRILVPVSSFIAGIFAPILIDRLTKGINSEQQLTLLTLIGFLLALIVLVIAISVVFFERYLADKEILQIQRDIISGINKTNTQFGLLVEYIEDNVDGNEGISYEVTKKIIEEAQSSLVILDAWQQTEDYPLINSPGNSLVLKRRQAYYDTIVQQIEKHRYDGTLFHRRIIQIPPGSDVATFKLIAGTVFSDYLKKCLRMQAETPAASVFKIAPLIINAHWIIIDGRYLIWPIITANSGRSGGLRRHGAIIFDDPLQQFVPRMMTIYHQIDTMSIPLKIENL